MIGASWVELQRDWITDVVATGLPACPVVEIHYQPRQSVARQARRPVATKLASSAKGCPQKKSLAARPAARLYEFRP